MKKTHIEDQDTAENSPNAQYGPAGFVPVRSSQPELYRHQPPSFMQLFFSRGWKHRIFSNSANGNKFVALTQAIITSQVLGVLMLIVLSSFNVSE